jgi:hypothetical protein
MAFVVSTGTFTAGSVTRENKVKFIHFRFTDN